MYAGFTYQEIALLLISSFLLLGLIIAALNLDATNKLGIGYLMWTKKTYNNTSGFQQFLAGLFRLPSNLGDTTKHEGWKAGLSLFSLGISILLYLGIVLAIGLFLVAIWGVIKWILIILVVLIVIGAFSK